MKSSNIHFSGDHLGGCLSHIHYLNKLGLEVDFYVDKKYHYELKLWANDNLNLRDIRDYKGNGFNAWMGNNGYWYNHPERWKGAKNLLRFKPTLLIEINPEFENEKK